MKTIVFYHYNCFDGTMAAAAALKAVHDGYLPKDTVITPISYQDKFFDEGGVFEKVNPTHEHSTVYFLDFCPTAETLKRLSDEGHAVVVLDHHESAVKNVAEARGLKGLDLYFDMGRSGAVMAWDYFFRDIPRKSYLRHLPALAMHVGDRDLWKFEMEGTREAIAWLSVSAKLNDPQSYLDAALDFEAHHQYKIEIGSFICTEMDVQIANMESKWRWVDIEGFPKGAIVNATSYPSEVCEAIYDAHQVPYVIAYNITKDGKVAMSFRSKKGAAHSIRVNDLAELFGGGGHPNSAGGAIDLETLHELLISSKSQSKGVKANSSQACSC